MGMKPATIFKFWVSISYHSAHLISYSFPSSFSCPFPFLLSPPLPLDQLFLTTATCILETDIGYFAAWDTKNFGVFFVQNVLLRLYSLLLHVLTCIITKPMTWCH